MNQASSAIRKFHLMDQYKTFTHGGNYWRDNYRLNYWDECVQPVVYRNNIYYGYKLLRRLGDWNYLTCMETSIPGMLPFRHLLANISIRS
ncbi:uncharacterized protein HRG_04581 [Hirsutella rhossiliensis]|uniref:Uncharacterized protein n=1 Tax=Hirsutella rhossiliensis TaxID=111463 RepID=A0A9P8MY11_9HYPO|nr:uncharacterized protein HRG_04581 [Hirsutella rhossiliensis]KAH0964153.1 hypothetical protein HRG_04581 [Hirsutella rhossiliensis]